MRVGHHDALANYKGLPRSGTVVIVQVKATSDPGQKRHSAGVILFLFCGPKAQFNQSIYLSIIQMYHQRLQECRR
jgi:hypothetical protein